VSWPNFVEFRGVEWDGTRDRVIALAAVASESRIISLDSSLNPASMTVLRSGLDTNAWQVDVDPETGRLYWWENDQILSVDSDGTGVPVVEADMVPEPLLMEIDPERNRYFISTNVTGDMQVGPLGAPGSTHTFNTLSHGLASSFMADIDIEPISGDLIWTEFYVDLTTGVSSSVVRADNTGMNAAAEYQNTTPQTSSFDSFYGVGLIGDQLGLTVHNTTLGAVRLQDVNFTTGLVRELSTDLIFVMDIAYNANPIIAQPESVLVDVGGIATLQVESFDPSSTYQWRKQGVNLSNDDRVSGVHTDTLTITDAQLIDTNAYTCRVVDGGGEAGITEPVLIAVRGEEEPECVPDLNGDGSLNFLDVSAYLSAYAAGCP
jgi:Immunoglobulin domain